MASIGAKHFLIVGIAAAVAYRLFGPIGLGVLALFMLLNMK